MAALYGITTADSPDFYSSKIQGDRFTNFRVHTARFSANRLQKVGRLEKNMNRQWDHGNSRNVPSIPRP